MAQGSEKKLSRREREERRMTRRWMLIGGGMLTAATVAGAAILRMPAAFPVLTGEGTIYQRLQRNGLEGHVLRLDPEADRIDLLVIGTTDCGFCREFVEDGLGPLTARARELGLGVAYAAIGGSPSSLGSTRAVETFARAGVAAREDALRAAYAVGADMRAGEAFESALRWHGSRLGLSEEDLSAAFAEDPIEVAGRIQRLMGAFQVAGTPAFYVASASDPALVSIFNGFAGSDGVLRQVEAARAVQA